MGDYRHRLFKSIHMVSKVNAKMNACFIDHLLCAGPACQEEVREQQGRGGEKRLEGKEKIMGARGGRRKGRIEIERGEEREIKVCLREGT